MRYPARFWFWWFLLLAIILMLTFSRPVGASPLYSVVSIEASFDNGMCNGVSAGSNYGTDTQIYVGESNASATVCRSLLKFDLSGIPADAVVSSAAISLYVAVDRSDNVSTYSVYRVTQAWTELGSSWNNSDTVVAWASPGGDYYSGAALGSASVGSAVAVGSEVAIPLNAAQVGFYISGIYPNYGFLVRSGSENNDSYFFYSSEDLTSTRRPRLVIDYSLPAATFTPTVTATPTLVPTGTYAPGDRGFEFHWRYLIGIIFVVTGLIWEGVFFFYIWDYLVRYGENVVPYVAGYVVIVSIVRFIRGLGKEGPR